MGSICCPRATRFAGSPPRGHTEHLSTQRGAQRPTGDSLALDPAVPSSPFPRRPHGATLRHHPPGRSHGKGHPSLPTGHQGEDRERPGSCSRVRQGGGAQDPSAPDQPGSPRAAESPGLGRGEARRPTGARRSPGRAPAPQGPSPAPTQCSPRVGFPPAAGPAIAASQRETKTRRGGKTRGERGWMGRGGRERAPREDRRWRLPKSIHPRQGGRGGPGPNRGSSGLLASPTAPRSPDFKQIQGDD